MPHSCLSSLLFTSSSIPGPLHSLAHPPPAAPQAQHGPEGCVPKRWAAEHPGQQRSFMPSHLPTVNTKVGKQSPPPCATLFARPRVRLLVLRHACGRVHRRSVCVRVCICLPPMPPRPHPSFSALCVSSSCAQVPAQDNHCDCGLFVASFPEFFTYRLPPGMRYRAWYGIQGYVYGCAGRRWCKGTAWAAVSGPAAGCWAEPDAILAPCLLLSRTCRTSQSCLCPTWKK